MLFFLNSLFVGFRNPEHSNNEIQTNAMLLVNLAAIFNEVAFDFDEREKRLYTLESLGSFEGEGRRKKIKIKVFNSSLRWNVIFVQNQCFILLW